MITRRVMAAGSFDFRLRDGETGAPAEIVDKLNIATAGFGQVIFTSTRVPAEALSAASLRKASYFVGILRTQSGRSYGGASPLILLGDEDGKGEILTSALTLGSSTIATWATNLLPSNGIVYGTAPATSGSWTGPIPAYITRRAGLELAASGTGDEFRQSIDSSGNICIDVGSVAGLYGTTPAGMVIARDGGFEPGVIGLRAVELGDAMDVEDYTSKVHWVARGDGGATVGTASAGSVPYYAPGGAATVKMERVVDATAAAGVDASAMATVELGKYQSLRREFQVRVDADDLFGFTHSASGATTTSIRDGDYLYIYDPANGIKDTANQVVYRGDVLCPLKLRVYGITVPILRGGVYFVAPDAAQTVTDLSDWVEWETGDATLTVGAQSRPLLGGSSPGSGPYGDVPPALASDAWPTFNPTLTQSGAVGKTNTYTKVRRIGRTIIEQGYLTCDGTGAPVGANAITVSTSTTAVQAGALPVGTALIIDASTGNYYRATAHMLTTGTIGFMSTNTNTGAYLGANDFVAALAVGDVVAYEITYEAATS